VKRRKYSLQWQVAAELEENAEEKCGEAEMT